MRAPQLTARRSALVTAGAVTAVVALVTGVAIASGGYASQRVDLGDAAVWVASDRWQAIGRANTAVLELNSVVETGGTGSVIVQDGATVLVLDPDRASVGLVDATTSTLTETVAVPPDGPTVSLAGERVVVAAAGDVWTVPVEEFADFDSEAEPMLTFGAGSVTSVDPRGTLFAYTPSTGVVARVDAADADTVASRWQLEPLQGDPDVQITSVAGHWAVLDVAARSLHLEGRGVVDLSDLLDPGEMPVLQAPSLRGDEVAIAHRQGLIAVRFDGADPRSLVDGRFGVPAAPVMHQGCLNAAWALGYAWRSCAAADGRLVELEDGTGGGGDLAFLANGDALVLNDRKSGKTWAPSAGYGLIDNWDTLLAIERDEETVEQNDPETPPTIEKSQVPPVVVADEFGARPGRSTLLPVLLNDYDANGDVLVVDGVDGQLPPGATLDRVSENQQLQLTLDDAASGTIAFGYLAGDGRGGSARATVVVHVRGPDENAPPVQQRPTHATVEAGGRVSTPVLGDWVDPDGDPFFLRQALVEPPDTLSSTAEGVVVFDEGGGNGSERTVSLVVSDGRDQSVGTLGIGVRAPGDVPLVADPFVALATAGQEIRIDPLRHVRGGAGQIRLTAVPAKPDAVLTPDFDGGSFRFTSAQVRTHLLEYTVTDGTQTATGVVRVDVSAPPERDTTPITVPHTAFLRTNQPVDIDVLATDIDPTGGVLVVTEVDDADAEAARIEVIDHRILRVTLTGPLETGSTTFGYRVSNGLAEAEGEVTLVEVPMPERTQPPVATPDTISARTGDVIDIPVLANDEHPDALPITLAAGLIQEPEDGLLFVAGDRLRYYAPEAAGEFEAAYRVDGPDGQYATGSVHISVREADPETNSPPVPATVTARVIAGETVRIPIPLGGADPDGDSVQLIGQESNPERGNVTARGVDWLEYQAGEYSAGTDTFQYAVVDALGAPATGSVRVGIAPRVDGARLPIAVEDLVTVRPGRTISVRVLENDSDPDGGSLRLVDVQAINDATAVIEGEHLDVTIPDVEGGYGFIYTVENEHLGSAKALLRVEARADAPLAWPEASDTVLGLSDILDVERIDVPVLRNVFLADGDVADLEVALVEGYDAGAEVRRNGSIRVDVEDRRRIIPFSVTHPEDPTIVAYAFIWVPGRDDALPQLRSDAPDVRVASGEEVRLDLEDYVIAASGKPVRITDTATVRASHSDGSELTVDEDTLRYSSEVGYFGPASLSFTVTDGESVADPDGRTGTIVIPIDVLPTENQPPAFTGGVIEFEPGQTRKIELVKLTNYPYPDALDELEFQVLAPAAEGFSVSLDGQELTIKAEESTPKGTPAAIAIGVADGAGEGRPGRIDVRVVPSTLPLAQPAPDTAIAPRGRTTSIDVLANDRASNPFPDTPLRVVGVRGLDADNLPDDVVIVPSADRTTLAVTVGPRAAPVNTTVQYQVADATDDPSRYAWGTVTISVQDRPDPVTGAAVTGFGDGTLDVVFGAGGFNNSPITGYEISLVDPSSRDVVSTSECVATTCTVPTPGNGQSNAVMVRVQARNGVGLSDPVEAPGPIWSDIIPPPPTGLRAVPLDGRLRIEWSPVPTGSGSSVESYVVTVAGVSSEVSASGACTATLCAADSQGLENGSQVPITVSARNQAYPALAVWTEAGGTGTPFGPPVAGSISVNGDAAAGTVTVSWSPFSGNGDAIGGYFVQRLVEGATSVPTGPQACSVTSPAPGTVVAPASGGIVAEVVQVGADASSVQFTGTATESARYSFLVWGYNRAGCANTEVVGTIVRPAPGSVGVRSNMEFMNVETWDRYISGIDGGAWRYEIIAVDGNGAQIPGTGREFRGTGWLRELLNRPFGETARFQVRGCSIWGSCGPWSQTLPSETSPSLTFALPSRTWTDAPTATWAWTAAPENSGLPATFRCGMDGDGDGTLAQTPTSCTVTEAKKGDRVWLDVEVAGVEARYWNR